MSTYQRPSVRTGCALTPCGLVLGVVSTHGVIESASNYTCTYNWPEAIDGSSNFESSLLRICTVGCSCGMVGT